MAKKVKAKPKAKAEEPKKKRKRRTKKEMEAEKAPKPLGQPKQVEVTPLALFAPDPKDIRTAAIGLTKALKLFGKNGENWSRWSTKKDKGKLEMIEAINEVFKDSNSLFSFRIRTQCVRLVEKAIKQSRFPGLSYGIHTANDDSNCSWDYVKQWFKEAIKLSEAS